MRFTPLHPAIVAVLAAVVVTAAVWDWRTRRIPNWLNVAGVVLGVAANTALGGLAGLKFALLGFAVGFAVKLVFFLLHLTSAGDVKLMAAVGAIVGASNWVAIFALTAIVGGVWAMVLVVMKRRVTETAWNIRYLLGEMKGGRAPYRGKEELNVSSPKALTMPRGPVNALGALIFVALGPYLQ